MSKEEDKIKDRFWKPVNDFFDHLPKWVTLSSVLFVLICLACWWILNISPVKAAGLLVAQFKKETPKPVGPQPEQCDSGAQQFESVFQDQEHCKWIGMDGLDVTKRDFFKLVKPKITDNFLGGRDIFFPVVLSPNFQTTFSFIPQNSKKINVAINYGYLWRVIVGSGDYNQVVMQKNAQYSRQDLGTDDWVIIPEKNGGKWIKRNGQLDPQKRVTIHVSSRARQDSSVISVKVTVTGFIDGQSHTQEFDFDYDVDTPDLAVRIREKIGIGLLDPYGDGEVETELHEFILNKL